MLPEYQFTIADLYTNPIGNVNLFDKEKFCAHYENFNYYMRLGLKLKKTHHVLEFNQSQRLKTYIELNKQKTMEA